MHHPAADIYAWNSFESTFGIEQDALHGVEIWNGAKQAGQGGAVDDWVDWLLAGRILYAYSGSDTHDAAFAFGANHAVFVNEAFTQQGLERVLKAGRVYVSDGHQLILEAAFEGQTVMMGGLQALAPGQPASALAVTTHYDFGSDTSTITLFRGRVGDGSETTLCTSGPLTGSGSFVCNDTLDPVNRTWYRAYSETAGATVTAYTNPVFFLPGSCTYTAFGGPLGGANVGTISSASNPTLGSVNKIDVSFAATSPFAVVVASENQIPGGFAFLGGTLLAAPPFVLRQPGTHSGTV